MDHGRPIASSSGVDGEALDAYSRVVTTVASAVAPAGLVTVPAPLPEALAFRSGQGTGLRVVEAIPGAPAARAGISNGDLVLTVAGAPVGDAQSLQRLLFADAIGRPMPITVVRKGAMVDVVTMPSELSAL